MIMQFVINNIVYFNDIYYMIYYIACYNCLDCFVRFMYDFVYKYIHSNE